MNLRQKMSMARRVATAEVRAHNRHRVYVDLNKANEVWQAMLQFMLFIGAMAVILGGGFAVLVILHHMERIWPAYCIVAMGVYVYTVAMTFVVATNYRF